MHSFLCRHLYICLFYKKMASIPFAGHSDVCELFTNTFENKIDKKVRGHRYILMVTNNLSTELYIQIKDRSLTQVSIYIVYVYLSTELTPERRELVEKFRNHGVKILMQEVAVEEGAVYEKYKP